MGVTVTVLPETREGLVEWRCPFWPLYRSSYFPQKGSRNTTWEAYMMQNWVPAVSYMRYPNRFMVSQSSLICDLYEYNFKDLLVVAFICIACMCVFQTYVYKVCVLCISLCFHKHKMSVGGAASIMGPYMPGILIFLKYAQRILLLSICHE